MAAPRGTTSSGYRRASGTSVSAPIVSAAASWVRRLRPGLDPIQTADVLRDGARDLGAKGFDRTFGFGLVDVAGALAAEKPAREPREPNEDIEFVTGRTFGQAPLLATRRSEILDGFLDDSKDPMDVVPVRIRARSSLQITLAPDDADVDVEIFSRGARTVLYGGKTPPPTRIDAGVRSGTRRERVTVDNPSRRAVKVYLAIYNADRGAIQAPYRLMVSNRRLRA